MTAAPIHQLFPNGTPPAEEAPNSTIDIPGPHEPLKVARLLLDEMRDGDHTLVRWWRGEWWQYVGPHWRESEPAAVRKWLYDRLADAVYATKGDEGEVEYKPWNPDKTKVDKVLDAMVTAALLGRDTEAPSWLSTGDSAAGYVPCLNGLVDVNTREIVDLTPDYFGTVGIPLEYDPNAGEPTAWLAFLRTLWQTEDGTDAEEIRVLRQWFGYVLSGRMDLQKMLLIIGPPRSGKGTVARILRDLVGKANTSAPTLAMMSQNFGLTDTIGKTLAIVGDARLGTNGQETVVERLLSISGQDTMTIDRKNKTAWTGTLQSRVMILSNELPKFGDASGAVASRFVIVKMEESFLGREDTDLEDRLRAEFPEILKWALEGLEDLNTVRRFTVTERHTEAMESLYDLVSPISAFVRDCCETDDVKATAPFADLYAVYEAWCDRNRRGAATGTARFSEQLKSRLPMVKTNYRPTVKGVKSPVTYVRGITITPEWRVILNDRNTGGYAAGSGWGRGTYVPPDAPMPGY